MRKDAVLHRLLAPAFVMVYSTLNGADNAGDVKAGCVACFVYKTNASTYKIAAAIIQQSAFLIYNAFAERKPSARTSSFSSG